LLDARESGVTDGLDAAVDAAGFRAPPPSAEIENWPCAASSAFIVAGDSAPEAELLDGVESDWDESEPDTVNGSAPLPKNPLFFVEDEADETCEARDLTASHAADAAPKAISMIKPHNAAACGCCFHVQ
jgi:hypothetical protein